MCWCNNVALRNLDLYIVVYIVHRVVSFWDWIALCFFPAPIPDAHGRFVLVGQGIWQPRMCNLILPFYTNMQCLQISFVTSPPECNVLNPKTLSHRAAVRGHPDGWDAIVVGLGPTSCPAWHPAPIRPRAHEFLSLRSCTSLFPPVTCQAGYQSHRMTPSRACDTPLRTSTIRRSTYVNPPPYTVETQVWIRIQFSHPTAPPRTLKCINNSQHTLFHK